MRTTIVCLALCMSSICCAQDTNAKASPKQQALIVKQDSLRVSGSNALSAEFAPEKAKPCPGALDPHDPQSIDGCPDFDFRNTQKNYETYIHALSGLLTLGGPTFANPSGLSKDFDKSELRWADYRVTQCRTASYDDGTQSAHHQAVYLNCERDLTRRHLDELAHLYADLW